MQDHLQQSQQGAGFHAPVLGSQKHEVDLAGSQGLWPQAAYVTQPMANPTVGELGAGYSVDRVQHAQRGLPYNPQQLPHVTVKQEQGSSELDPAYADDDFLREWSAMGRRE